METLYIKFNDLPASQVALDQYKKAQEIFDLAVKAIKYGLKEAEDKFIAQRDEARANAKFEFYMTEPVVNEYGTHYQIHRKALNPVIGDTDFYKEINYSSFKIVNNVFISTGSGYQLPIRTGEVLHQSDVESIKLGIVPEIFKKKKQ